MDLSVESTNSDWGQSTYSKKPFTMIVTAGAGGIFGPKNMSDEAKAYWNEKLKVLSETEQWKLELQKVGLQNGYLGSDAFYKYLEKEDATYLKTYEKLGIAKDK
ncbi:MULTISPECIES: hypothetical protein [unclassified Paenibacillus]|uniref:hypothetical protein n=1 Tax=unclassified Paenibacillus TaxID=185978 RepID=UPI00363A5F33